MNSQTLDGYRYFFPAGWILGVWGVLLWLLFPLSLVSYPGLVHPEIMMGGFFLCFACGFLMTAAPRFTKSFGPAKWEQNLSQALIALLFASLVFPGKVAFYVVDLLLFLFLIQFLARRFLARQANPPDAFIFVGVGLFAGLLGNIILLGKEFFELPTEVYTFGRLLFLQAYILSLVVGVGSRLIPALLGWAPLPTEEGRTPPKFLAFLSLGGIFLSSYLLEVWIHAQVANVLRAMVLSLVGGIFWHLFTLPKRRQLHAYLLWVSSWLLILGQWGVALFPTFRVHALHVVFVAGLASMTLLIATRVSLSHGNHSLEGEKRSKALGVGVFLIIFAGLTRLSAGFAPQLYQSHLVYASYTWILGLLVWGAVFLPKMLRVHTP